MSSTSASLKIPDIIYEAMRERAALSFDGNFNGYVLSLIRTDLSGTNATAEEVFQSTPMSGINRDRTDEEIARLFRSRLHCLRKKDPQLPSFLQQAAKKAA